MRILKFRAWDVEEKEMLTQWSVNEHIEMTQPFRRFENCEIMQFTGLKDKNGKEIYENDLFDCIYKFDGCNKHKLEVVWNEASAGFKLKGHGECHQPNVSKTIGDLYHLEIIGNVYKTPNF